MRLGCDMGGYDMLGIGYDKSGMLTGMGRV